MSTEISAEKAQSLVALFERVTGMLNADEFVAGFTEDCVVRFNCHPEIHGRDALRQFIAPRFASRAPNSYKIQKTLLAISGDVLGVEWVNSWNDAARGKSMTGRGLEFWTMRGDQIACWNATYVSAAATTL